MKEPAIIPELACRDYQKSYAFYTDVLGFNTLYTREDEGFAMIEHNGSQIMIDEIGQSRTWETGALEYPLGRGINFQIQVESVEPLYQSMKDKGYSIFLELEEKWYRIDNNETGNKQFCVLDPDGYLLRFFEDLGERKIT